jgi:hypothetical protein
MVRFFIPQSCSEVNTKFQGCVFIYTIELRKGEHRVPGRDLLKLRETLCQPPLTLWFIP